MDTMKKLARGGAVIVLSVLALSETLLLVFCR